MGGVHRGSFGGRSHVFLSLGILICDLILNPKSVGISSFKWFSSWWFQPPAPKICSSNWSIFPRGENKKPLKPPPGFWSVFLFDVWKTNTARLSWPSFFILEKIQFVTLYAYPLINEHSDGISRCLPGNTSSIRVHFPACYVRLPECITSMLLNLTSTSSSKTSIAWFPRPFLKKF